MQGLNMMGVDMPCVDKRLHMMGVDMGDDMTLISNYRSIKII
jgi:hypothetical protein